MELKGSKTEANLATAFAGESQAYTKYGYYSSQAKKDGYEQIAALIDETSMNEKEHAKIWFKLLHDGMPGTVDNLLDAIAGEHYESTDMYVNFAKVAKEEGFDNIASLFEKVGAIEATHETRYRDLRERILNNTAFKSPGTTTNWVCRNCGYVHSGDTAPLTCPVCSHPQSFYERQATNY